MATTKDNSAALADAMAAFLASGGKVTQCAPGERAQPQGDPRLADCPCGCEGDYTDHTMRLGERGIYGSH